MRGVRVLGSQASGLLSALRIGGRPDSRTLNAAQTQTIPPQSGKPPSLLLSPGSARAHGQRADGDKTGLTLVLAPSSGYRNRTTAAATHGPRHSEGSGVSTQACPKEDGSSVQLGNRLPLPSSHSVCICFAPRITCHANDQLLRVKRCQGSALLHYPHQPSVSAPSPSQCCRPCWGGSGGGPEGGKV